MADEEIEGASSEEDSSSSSEEEDEDGKEWTEETEKTFLKTLSSLKSKDPKIYDENVKFFKNYIVEQNDPKPDTIKKNEKTTEEPMFLRDYERKIILEKGGILTDEESDDENKIEDERANSPTYVEEQKTLKENFKKMLASDNESSDDEGDCAGFLKVKIKDAQQKATEEEEYIEWLKGQKTELSDKETEGALKFLRDYWTNPQLNEGEQFLRDYILNKRYMEKNEEDTVESEVSFSEEERILDECDEYEQKYNFRFEEPDKEFVKTYPRVIETSLRRKDEKRKLKREERKKRKVELLEQKRLEVKQLKKKKTQEFLEKIQKLKELTGNKELGFDGKDLLGDFNPDEYDKKMSQLFNEEFYDNNDGDDEKPRISDLDSNFDSEEENVDNDLEFLDHADPEAEDNTMSTENGDFIMDCDYESREERESKFKKQTRSSKRKGHKKSTFMQVVKKEKPVFDPTDKTYQQYLDEYYGLEFEDIVGDMPCRFKYRNVLPNDFGLSIEEILAADDKELNNWCSMQKVDTIRPEQNEKFDKKSYAKRAQNFELKKKFLPSLFTNEEVLENNEIHTTEAIAIKKKKKKRRKRKNSMANDQQIVKNDTKNEKNKETRKRKAGDEAVNSSNKETKMNPKSELPAIQNRKRKAEVDAVISPKRKTKMNLKSDLPVNENRKHNPHKKTNPNKFKNFKNKQSKTNSIDSAISDERLKAYGFNPKKFKNKMKYGQS